MSRLGYKRVGGSQRHVGAILALALFAVIMILSTSAGGALPTPALFELDGNATTRRSRRNPRRLGSHLLRATGIHAPRPRGAGRILEQLRRVERRGPVRRHHLLRERSEGHLRHPGLDRMRQQRAARRTSFSTCSRRPTRTRRTVTRSCTSAPTATRSTATRTSASGSTRIPTFGLKAGASFNGVHENGDLFVVSAFTNGGIAADHRRLPVAERGHGERGPRCRLDRRCVLRRERRRPDAGVRDRQQLERHRNGMALRRLDAGSVPANGFFEGGIDLSVLHPVIDASVLQLLPGRDAELAGADRDRQGLRARIAQQLRLDRAEEDMVRWRDRQHDSQDRVDGRRERCRAGHDRHEPQRRHDGCARCRAGHVLRQRDHDPELHLEPRLREQQGRHEPERQRRSEQQRPAGCR